MHGYNNISIFLSCMRTSVHMYIFMDNVFLAPAVTVGETEGAMDPASVFFLPLLLPITL